MAYRLLLWGYRLTSFTVKITEGIPGHIETADAASSCVLMSLVDHINSKYWPAVMGRVKFHDGTSSASLPFNRKNDALSGTFVPLILGQK
jgi:hypothetical protein